MSSSKRRTTFWHATRARVSDPDQHARLAELKIQLDRTWDFLRQRRALRQYGLDPEGRQHPWAWHRRELRRVASGRLFDRFGCLAVAAGQLPAKHWLDSRLFATPHRGVEGKITDMPEEVDHPVGSPAGVGGSYAVTVEQLPVEGVRPEPPEACHLMLEQRSRRCLQLLATGSRATRCPQQWHGGLVERRLGRDGYVESDQVICDGPITSMSRSP